MKTILGLLAFLGSSSTWALDLPKSCESLAYKFASVQGDVEDFSQISDVDYNSQDGTYSILLKADDTASYTMTFNWNSKSDVCLINTLKGSYR